MSWKTRVDHLLRAVAPKIWLSFNIARHNRHFEPEYWLLPQLCDRNAVSIDVGGNTGVFAYYLARLSREVQVFEPNPICLAQLSRVRTRNMIVHSVGLSDRRGEAVIRFDPRNTGVGTVEAKNPLTDNLGITSIAEHKIGIATLDDFDLHEVAFMKVDVEGHEPSVLRGASRLLEREQPNLLIECELRHNPTAFSEIHSLLAAVGYTCWRLHQGRLIPVAESDIEHLQQGLPESNPDYVNTFIFLSRRRGAGVATST